MFLLLLILLSDPPDSCRNYIEIGRFENESSGFFDSGPGVLFRFCENGDLFKKQFPKVLPILETYAFYSSSEECFRKLNKRILKKAQRLRPDMTDKNYTVFFPKGRALTTSALHGVVYSLRVVSDDGVIMFVTDYAPANGIIRRTIKTFDRLTQLTPTQSKVLPEKEDCLAFRTRIYQSALQNK